MAPTYSQHTDPTPAQLTAFMATFPPIAGAEGAAGAPPAAAGEGGGQGEVASDTGSSDLYAQAIERVPAELREHVEPILKEWDGSATKKFQEAAEFRKTWEPYGELGVTDVPPETMEQLLGWYEMTNDEGQFKSWLQTQAEAFGLLTGESGAGAGDGGDGLGEGLEGSEFMTREQFQQELQQFTAGQKAEQELTAKQKETEAKLDARFAERSGALGLAELPDDKRARHENAIWAIAQTQYAQHADPVGQAFDDYEAIIGQHETDLLRKKLNVPPSPEGGGGAADTSVARPTTLAEASELMRGRLRANSAAA